MNKTMHIPMRMCAVTREKLPKRELLRFVVKDGELVLDKGERVRGRGLNIKPDVETFNIAIKRKVFERNFNIKLNNDKLAGLREEVEKYINERFREKQVVRVKKEELDKLKIS